MKRLTVEWFYAAIIRALRTFAQVAISMVTVGQAFLEVNWLHILSVSGTAAIVSLLTSFATNLPEAVPDSGILRIDSNDPDKDIYQLDISNLETIQKSKYVKLKVDPTANLNKSA